MNEHTIDLSSLLPDEPTVEARGRAIATEVRKGASRRHSARRRPAIAIGALAIAAAAGAVVLIAGSSSRPTRAYGAELVRFAQSTPLLLFERPGWEVRNMSQTSAGEGVMEFGPESADSAEAHISRLRSTAENPVPGLRKVELTWVPLNRLTKRILAEPDRNGFTTTFPVLDTTASVDPGVRLPFPGAHHLLSTSAIWQEGGRLMGLRAYVRDLSAFRESLASLHGVDAETWLDAMPARVVKAAEYGAEIKTMLTGVPMPTGFDPSSITNPHLTTNRYSVGKAVGGAVACAWFERWYEAGASLSQPDARRARQVLLGSGDWPVFRRIRREGPYPSLVIAFARALPSGRYGHHRLLRGMVRRSCAALGAPFKLARQR